MKLSPKRLCAAALALLFIICLAGCGKSASSPSSGGTSSRRETSKDAKTDITLSAGYDTAIALSDLPFTLEVRKCVDKNGFFCILAKNSLDLTADFGSENPAEWVIFVLDSEFKLPLPSIFDEYKPVLFEDGGEFSVKKGQMIYIYCPSVAKAPTGMDPLTLTAAGAGS